MTNVIRAEGLSLEFPVFAAADYSVKMAALRLFAGRRPNRVTFKAIDNLSFEVKPGERLGLYGPNGCGKSTLLRILAGIYPLTSGRLEVQGDVTPILGLGTGINIEMSGEANASMLLRVNGVDATPEMIDAVWQFTDLSDDFRRMPLKSFSSGMQMRLLMSAATIAPVDILLLDEWISVMDVNFQEKSAERMRELAANSRIMVLASHNIGLLKNLCSRIFYLENGRIVDIEHCDNDPKPAEAVRFGTQ